MSALLSLCSLILYHFINVDSKVCNVLDYGAKGDGNTLDTSAIKDRPLEGYIGFQDEAKRVWYRNVRIKRL